jgi:hypothetical protein
MELPKIIKECPAFQYYITDQDGYMRIVFANKVFDNEKNRTLQQACDYAYELAVAKCAADKLAKDAKPKVKSFEETQLNGISTYADAVYVHFHVPNGGSTKNLIVDGETFLAIKKLIVDYADKVYNEAEERGDI